MTSSYTRPVKATLHVHLENGESWEVTKTDLEKFDLVSRHEAYAAFEAALIDILTRGGLLDGSRDIVDTELNPVRYLVETAITSPDLLDHPEHVGWVDIVMIERALRAARRGDDDDNGTGTRS